MGKIKVGIVGTGYTVGIANAHVRGYLSNPDADLVALYDIIPGRAKKWAEERGLNDVKICSTYDELLNEVEAISICTPNYSHVPLVIRGIEHGKHVLCEKPLSISYEEAKKAVMYAKSSNVVNMIGFSYRGIPAIKLMKKFIDDGKMGKIFTYRETLGGNRIANPTGVMLEWRMQEDLSGSGALADFGCHMLDLADYLLRDVEGEIKEISGFTNTFIKERRIIESSEIGQVTNDDSAVFSAKTENGALLSFVASRLGVARHTLEIYGSGGMMLFRDDKPQEVEVMFKDINGGYDKKPEFIKVPDEYITDPWFNDEINRFIGAIINKERVQPDLERGLYIQHILDKITEASKENKVVTL